MPQHPNVLRFDGSLRGRGGGVGAALFVSGELRWQGARFVERLPTSAAAEYEALIFGLGAARRRVSAPLRVEGDCRLCILQMNGEASVRKLSKLHRQAKALAADFPQPLTLAHVPRSANEHADALARAAVEASAALYAASCVGLASAGQRQQALGLLCEARRIGAPRSRDLFCRLLRECEEAEDWSMLIAMYNEAEASASRLGPEAAESAIRALEARGMRNGRRLSALRQLARRRHSPYSQSTETVSEGAQGVGATTDPWVWPGSEVEGSIREWCEALVARAGGSGAFEPQGDAQIRPLLRVAEELASVEGIITPCSSGYFDASSHAATALPFPLRTSHH